MLVVLAETNILGYLNKRNIYPDYFFTDIDTFYKKVQVLDDVDILIILTGGCEFQRRKVFTMFKELREAMNEEYTSILSVEILSDLSIPQVEDYYKYEDGNIFNYKHYAGSKVLHSDGGFRLKDYCSEPKDSQIILSKNDLGIVDKYEKIIKSMKSKDDEYGKLLVNNK